MTQTGPSAPTFRANELAEASISGLQGLESVAGFDAEYHAIRRTFGIADMSDLGKLRVAGENARDVLDVVLTGNVQNLPENAMRNMLALDAAGSIVTDVCVYSGFDEYLLLTEAATLPVLKDEIGARCTSDVEITDLTDSHGMFRVDGPEAADLPRVLIGLEAAGLNLMSFAECRLDGASLTVGRIGSAGEWGYQFVAERDALQMVLERLLEIHPEILRCGRGVFNVLQMEVRSFNRRLDLPYGETPLAAGLHWMIDFRKPEFVGRDALMASKESLAKRMICLRMDDGAPVPPPGAAVHLDGQPVGYVANAAFSPALGVPIALAYLDAAVAVVGLPVAVAVDSEDWSGQTVSAPFVRTRSNLSRQGNTEK